MLITRLVGLVSAFLGLALLCFIASEALVPSEDGQMMQALGMPGVLLLGFGATVLSVFGTYFLCLPSGIGPWLMQPDRRP
jgi:hypothetical protein